MLAYCLGMSSIILHSDLNNFYASVERRLNPELVGVPLAVCGSREERHGIVLAKSEEAKRRGVKTGDTIFIDESSTSGIIAELLDPSLEITVVTNSLAMAGILADKRIRTYCTGGLILPDTASFVGNLPELLINVINADICFFSSSGISENGLICDQMAENAQTKRAMLSHSARKVYLCDHSKFDSSYTFIISSAADIDCLISDTEPPEKLKNLFKEIV